VTSQEKIQTVVLKMFVDAKLSFWGALLMSIPIERYDAVGTAGLTYKRSAGGPTILYSEKFIEDLSYEQLAYLLIHEVEHWIDMHPWRRGNRDPQVFNWSADRIINSNIEINTNKSSALSLKRPTEDLWLLEDPHKPGNVTAPEMYAIDIKQFSNKDGTKNQEFNSLEQTIQEAMDQGEPVLSIGNHDFWDEFPENMSEQEAQGQIKDACEAAANAAGSMPHNIRKKIEGFSADHQLRLQDYIRPWARNQISRKKEFTWARPHRLYGESLPGYRKIKGPVIGYVFDVSGSFSNEDIKESMKEALYLSKLYGARWLQADTEVKEEAKKFNRNTILNDGITRLGRGGTDMNPAIEYFMKDPKVGAVIVFTDGYLYKPVNTSVINKPLLFVISSKGRLLTESSFYNQVKIPPH
jgi:predicted metal-dependent peptidase